MGPLIWNIFLSAKIFFASLHFEIFCEGDKIHCIAGSSCWSPVFLPCNSCKQNTMSSMLW